MTQGRHQQPCKYFLSKQGCLRGQSCPFFHDTEKRRFLGLDTADNFFSHGHGHNGGNSSTSTAPISVETSQHRHPIRMNGGSEQQHQQRARQSPSAGAADLSKQQHRQHDQRSPLSLTTFDPQKIHSSIATHLGFQTSADERRRRQQQQQSQSGGPHQQQQHRHQQQQQYQHHQGRSKSPADKKRRREEDAASQDGDMSSSSAQQGQGAAKRPHIVQAPKAIRLPVGPQGHGANSATSTPVPPQLFQDAATARAAAAYLHHPQAAAAAAVGPQPPPPPLPPATATANSHIVQQQQQPLDVDELNAIFDVHVCKDCRKVYWTSEKFQLHAAQSQHAGGTVFIASAIYNDLYSQIYEQLPQGLVTESVVTRKVEYTVEQAQSKEMALLVECCYELMYTHMNEAKQMKANPHQSAETKKQLDAWRDRYKKIVTRSLDELHRSKEKFDGLQRRFDKLESMFMQRANAEEAEAEKQNRELLAQFATQQQRAAQQSQLMQQLQQQQLQQQQQYAAALQQQQAAAAAAQQQVMPVAGPQQPTAATAAFGIQPQIYAAVQRQPQYGSRTDEPYYPM